MIEKYNVVAVYEKSNPDKPNFITYRDVTQPGLIKCVEIDLVDSPLKATRLNESETKEVIDICKRDHWKVKLLQVTADYSMKELKCVNQVKSKSSYWKKK